MDCFRIEKHAVIHRALKMASAVRLLGALALLLVATSATAQQYTLRGTISDETTGETLIGATIIIQGTSTGTTTDIDGNFELRTNTPPPINLQIGYIGYVTKTIEVTDYSKPVKLALGTDQVIMSEVEVVGSRISEKQKQAPLTVEAMDVIAVKEAPSGSFYESLGNLKGVDVTSSSMGFKVINTRGFNSTSPVRSLQLIDGVDNQSPGLNFSLGNFLGAPDLDVMKVEVIAGASSAFYGPGAFNGVVNMTSKSPFLFKGLSAQIKTGERAYNEVGFRWADALKNKEGRDIFGYKINFQYLTANDWEATNYDPVYESAVDANNPGRFDAINIYGDEGFTATNNDFASPIAARDRPGLGLFYRSGYRESDLVDYDLQNLKLNTSLHYLIQKDLELSYAFSYGNGNTVYQGDNRYRLEDIDFFQNKIEISKHEKWFFRAYATHEDAGDTYDVVQTAFLLNEATRDDASWNTAYSTFWRLLDYDEQTENLPGYPSYDPDIHDNPSNWYNNFYVPFINSNNDSLQQWHSELLEFVDSQSNSALEPRYEPGTERFDSLYQSIISRDFSQGGSRFYDKSALYNAQGEYRITPWWGIITLGASGRLYTPDSRGTIFSDTLEYTRATINGETVITDSTYRQITNYQYGAYAGIDIPLSENKYRLNATLRYDKNENFAGVFSPAASVVWSPNVNHTFRLTFTSAVRNPTLADQFLYYDVGRAILLGNIDGVYSEGRDSLITLESFDDYRNSPSLAEGLSELEYFNVDAIQPEKVRTLEAGYRGTLFERLYVDLGGYYSNYTDFIGFVIGIDATFNPDNGFPVGGIQPYRLAANAKDNVTTRGFSIGSNYFYKRLTLSANYSWNQLVSGDEDPIIPAFNTPEHKYNVGLSGTELKFLGKPNWGFNMNYRWIQGFLFEGSPQFTGFVESYGMLDAQVNYTFKIKNKPNQTLNLKAGASNLLDNRVFQVYGGPTIGRLAFVALSYEWNKK